MADTTQTQTRSDPLEAAVAPLREDVRFLGALLGDTVCEQAGDRIFDLVETARRTAFAVRRSEAERDEVAALFRDVATADVIPVIRAFSLFALLANVAEDLHQDRRRRIHTAAAEPTPDGDLETTWRRLADAEADSAEVRGRLDRARETARVSPVLTAHPTETRRRTVFEVTRRVHALMRRRDALRTGTRDRVADAEIGALEHDLRREVLTLWKTAIIRIERPLIQYEVLSGLQYHEATLLDVIPPLNAEIAERLGCGERAVVRPGSWIGGDRDGNPYVTGEVVRFATERAAELVHAHCAEQLRLLERELSLSVRIVDADPDLLTLADSLSDSGSGDSAAERDEGGAAREAAPIRLPVLRERRRRGVLLARGDAGRSRPHRRRAHPVRRRSAALAATARPALGAAVVRFPPAVPGHAAELGIARGGPRRAVRAGR